MSLQKIYFVHEGKENYPEIAAYKTYFDGFYDCAEVHPDQLENLPDLKDAICWMIMGFYPRRPKARLVIHDYRSLSVGRVSWLKDRIKCFMNAVPDIRIFQNEAMADEMDFGAEVPSLYIPMGVPASVLGFGAADEAEKECDFCYIGVMSAERHTYLMFDSFLRRFGMSKTFHAYGTPEPVIENRYKEYKNIVFKGRHPQEKVFEALKQSRVAVNYFPVHRPHALQTPTKLLEYGALGLRILCNDQLQSQETAGHYGLKCLWGQTADMFAVVPDDLMWPDNKGFDPTPMLWPSVLAESGISAKLKEVLKKT